MSNESSEVRDPLVGARLTEAHALFELNQRRRAKAETTILTAAVLSIAAAVVALATSRVEVLLPLPPSVLVLASLAFQQYADFTVLGAARERLEDELHQRFGAEALLYERHVAHILKRMPLVTSIRAMQSLGWAAVVGALAVGLVAVADHPAWVVVVYLIALGATGLSCALSYRAMRHAGNIAREAFAGLFSR